MKQKQEDLDVSCDVDNPLEKEIIEEALRWTRNNQSLKMNVGEYQSPRISSEIPDCSMPMSFDSYKFCSLGCNYCAPAGTMINTKAGVKPIEELKVGDEVYSYNTKTQIVELDLVLTTMKNKTNILLEIELVNGKKIQLTPEHPVYVKGKGWIEAKDLSENDDLIFMKNAAISYHMSKNNPMKNTETAKKVSKSLKESYATGKLDQLKNKLSISGRRNIIKCNKSQKQKDIVIARMKANNPMKNAKTAKKMGKTMHEKWVNGELTSHFTGKRRPDVALRMTENNPMKDPVKRKKTLQKIVKSWIKNGRLSKGEICVRTALSLLPIEFTQQHVVSGPSRFYSLDFFLPVENICIEYDGHSGHYTEEGIARSKERDQYIQENHGIRTIRIQRNEAFIGSENLATLLQTRLQP